MVPIMLAYGQIAMRHMRMLHPNVSNFYINLTSCLVMPIIMLILGGSFDFLSDFDSVAWTYMIFIGLFFTLSAYFASIAIQLDSPARNQLYTYTGPVLQFIYDLTILNTGFTLI